MRFNSDERIGLSKTVIKAKKKKKRLSKTLKQWNNYQLSIKFTQYSVLLLIPCGLNCQIGYIFEFSIINLNKIY